MTDLFLFIVALLTVVDWVSRFYAWATAYDVIALLNKLEGRLMRLEEKVSSKGKVAVEGGVWGYTTTRYTTIVTGEGLEQRLEKLSARAEKLEAVVAETVDFVYTEPKKGKNEKKV